MSNPRRAVSTIEEPIDRKYTFTAISAEHGTEHSEFDSILFCCHDLALLPTLYDYRRRSQQLGAHPRQITGIDRLIERVERWQKTHPQLVKIADVSNTPEGNTIIADNLR